VAHVKSTLWLILHWFQKTIKRRRLFFFFFLFIFSLLTRFKGGITYKKEPSKALVSATQCEQSLPLFQIFFFFRIPYSRKPWSPQLLSQALTCNVIKLSCGCFILAAAQCEQNPLLFQNFFLQYSLQPQLLVVTGAVLGHRLQYSKAFTWVLHPLLFQIKKFCFLDCRQL
jgi:hypothetical protein